MTTITKNKYKAKISKSHYGFLLIVGYNNGDDFDSFNVYDCKSYKTEAAAIKAANRLLEKYAG